MGFCCTGLVVRITYSARRYFNNFNSIKGALIGHAAAEYEIRNKGTDDLTHKKRAPHIYSSQTTGLSLSFWKGEYTCPVRHHFYQAR